MPLKKLVFKPGISKETTNYANEGGWYSCDKIRFRSGSPEKIGGWTQSTPGQYYDGVCRTLINWADLSNNNLIGLGTHTKYYIASGGLYKDITPLNQPTMTLGSDPFETTSGSSIITVTCPAPHLAQVGDTVTFSGATGTTIGGIAASLFNNSFKITNIVSTTVFKFDIVEVAASDDTGGGAAVDADFQLNIGQPVFTIGDGWSAGEWNGSNKTVSTELVYTSGNSAGPNVLLDDTSTTINVNTTAGFSATGYIQIENELISYTGITATSFTGCGRGAAINGSSSPATYHATNPVSGSATPREIKVYQVIGLLGVTGWGLASSISFGVGQQLRLWTHDNFGEDLLISPRGNTIYYWANNTSNFPPAVTLSSLAGTAGFDASEVPRATNQILVSDVSRFVIALGSEPYDSNTFDPMLVRWSDQENPYQWVPAATNQSGEIRLSSGSYIVCGQNTRQEILIWTDSALYSMQYVGPPYVWKITLMGDNTSIISPNSAIVVNNVAFWMGTEKFYMYNGRVNTLNSTLRKYIFEDLNFDQRFQVVCGANEGFNEVWWFYVSNTEVRQAGVENRDPSVDKYVVYNHLEDIWYYGSLRRTAWLDSGIQSSPFAAVGDTNQGTLVAHEVGVNDQSTASPQPIPAFIESSDMDIDDGFNFSFVRRILPDITFTGSTEGSSPQVNFTMLPRRNAGSDYQKLTTVTPNTISATDTIIPVSNTFLFPTSGTLLIDSEKVTYTGKTPTSFTGCTRGALNTTATPHQVNTPAYFYDEATDVTRTAIYPVEEFTGQVYTRFRGRQLAIRIQSDKLGTAWQLGHPRIDIRPDGRK